MSPLINSNVNNVLIEIFPDTLCKKLCYELKFCDVQWIYGIIKL